MVSQVRTQTPNCLGQQINYAKTLSKDIFKFKKKKKN